MCLARWAGGVGCGLLISNNHDTMKRNFPTQALQSLTIVGSFVALGLASGLSAQAAEPIETDRQSIGSLSQRNAYPPEFSRAFLQSCTRSAQQSGQFNQQQATQYCQCSLAEFQSRYTLQQTMNLYQRMQQSNSNELPPEMMQIARTCVQRVFGTR